MSYKNCSHGRTALAGSYTWGEGPMLIGFRRAQPKERRDEWEEARRDFSQLLRVRHLGEREKYLKLTFSKL